MKQLSHALYEKGPGATSVSPSWGYNLVQPSRGQYVFEKLNAQM